MKQTDSSYSWKHDPLFWAYCILTFIPIIMVFTFYNYYQMKLCVYTGWVLLIMSIIIVLLAGYEFRMKGGAPEDKSIVQTTVLVDSGVYAVVRHPQYLGFILFVFSLVFMSQHWISVFSGLTGTALFYLDIIKEEQMSIVKFGRAYIDYMNKVPRLNFLLGIIRLLRARKFKKNMETRNF